LKHSLVSIDQNGGAIIDYKEVNLSTMTDEVEAVPPQKRVY